LAALNVRVDRERAMSEDRLMGRVLRRVALASISLFILAALAAGPSAGSAAAASSPFGLFHASAFAPVAASADMSVEVTDSQDPVNVNESYNYLVHAVNAGPDGASNVTVTVDLSHDFTVGTLPAGCSFFDDVPSNKKTVTCTTSELGNGGSLNYTIPVTPTLTGFHNAQARVTSDTSDPHSGNNFEEEFTNVLSSGATDADLQLSMSDSPDPVPLDGTFKLTFTVHNASSAGVEGVYIDYTPPSAVSVVGNPCDHVVESETLHCFIGHINAGATGTFKIDLQPNQEGVVSDDASATSNTNSDPSAENNGDSEDTTVGPPAHPPRTLTVTKAGGLGRVTSSPAGIDCGSTCSDSFADGTVVTLTATPASGGAFSGWGGACAAATGNKCTLTMNAAKSVSATFVPPRTLKVTRSGNGTGTVTSSPAGIDCGSHCTKSFPKGTAVTLTANPGAGSSFAGWGDDCLSATENTCTLTLDTAKSAVAVFNKGTSPLTVALARPFADGKAVVLSALVNGAPANRVNGVRISRLEWHFGTTTKTIVGRRSFTGALQTSIRIRPSVISSARVRVVAVLSGGSTATGQRSFFTRSFLAKHTPKDSTSKRVARALSSTKANIVYAVGAANVLTGRSASCGRSTIYAGKMRLDGCFRPIEARSDIPAAEGGAVTAVAKALHLPRSNSKLMRTMVGLTDGYRGTGRVLIYNHWPVDPHGGARIISYPQAKALTSSNATFRLVRRDVYGPTGRHLNLKLDPTRTSFRPGAGIDLKINRLGGFKVVARDNSTLLGQFSGKIATSVRLPGFIKRFGGPVLAGVELPVQPESADGNGMTIGPMKDIRFGDVPIHSFKIVYRESSNDWIGSGQACFFGITCFDLQPPYGGIIIQNDSLVSARTNRNFGSPGQPLAAGATLQNVNVGIGLDPTRLLGSARVGFARGIVLVDGRAVIAFPSSRTPYFLRRDEVGNHFPAKLYSVPFTNPMLALGADVFGDLPVLGTTRLGSGYATYELGGYGAFGGGSDLKILGVVRITGSVDAEFDVLKGSTTSTATRTRASSRSPRPAGAR
jgi:hypothetical protein